MSETNDLAFPLYPERRAMVQMAVLLAVLAVGWNIPLPGLDLDSFGAPNSLRTATIGFSANFSIFALGLFPFFTVLAYAEIARLAIPPLARWQAASSRNARRLAVVVFALSLALTAWQGVGILLGLSASSVVRPDAVGFIPAGLATFIGSTALLIWLTDNFGVTDLGGGFWPLMAMIALASFPERTSTLVYFIKVGQISGTEALIVILSLIAGVALVVFANKLVSRNALASGPEKTAILLWPTHLAGIVAGFAAALLPEIVHWPFVAVSFAETAYVALATLLIPAFVLAYPRSFLPSKSERQERWPLPVLLTIAAIQMALWVGAWLLPLRLGLPPIVYGGELLVIGTVMLALLPATDGSRQRSPVVEVCPTAQASISYSLAWMLNRL